MDRFIGQEPAKLYQQVHYLKSNMDRFIARELKIVPISSII